MKFTSCLLVLTLLSMLPARRCGNVLSSLIRNNILGPAVNYQQQSWPIDPDEGIRRRKEYVAANGLYGYRRVEMLGLGEDGREDERREQQRLRDSMGALSYEVPSS